MTEKRDIHPAMMQDVSPARVQDHQPSTPTSSNGNNYHDSEKLQSAKPASALPIASSEAAQLIASMSPEEYALAERQLLRKIDWKLIPWMTLLYLMSFLDRVNIGVARITGLTTQLELSSLEYSNASMIFFVSYVFFEVPSNLVLKKFRPSRWIPFTMVCWAICQTTMGLVETYGQLLALRFLLGMFESGLFPGLNFFLTGWYRREEINRRCAIFFAGAVLAGAFGGILGYAFSRMDGVGGKQGWSWIFIMEGIITFIVAVASFWMVHDWPDQARFLTPVEREMVLLRLKAEQGLAGEGSFNMRVVKSALTDWKTYCLMLMYIGAAEPLYSGSLFTPSIIAALGRFSVPQSLLLSTPPYVLCFMTTLATAWWSDRYRSRGVPLIFWSIICVIGYLLLLTIPIRYPGAQYFAVFVSTAAVGPLIATTIAWTGNTWGNHYKKAICMGLVFSAGNSGGIVSSQAYRGKDAPGRVSYKPGHATALAFGAMCGIMALILTTYFRRENRRRDAMYGPPPAEHETEGYESDEHKQRWGLEGMSREQIVELGDKHPAYRYII